MDVLPIRKGGIPVAETAIGSWQFTIQRIPFDAHEISSRYGQVAPRWEQKLTRLGFPEAYKKIVLHLISTGWLCGLLRPAKVLDCGLGTGVLSHALLTHYSSSVRLHGVDLSMAMLNRARSLVRSDAGVWLNKATIESLPYKSESFDMIMAAPMFSSISLIRLRPSVKWCACSNLTLHFLSYLLERVGSADVYSSAGAYTVGPKPRSKSFSGRTASPMLVLYRSRDLTGAENSVLRASAENPGEVLDKGGVDMARQILIPVHPHMLTDAILSRIEPLAGPGSEIVFLCPTDLTRVIDGFDEWVNARLRASGSGIQTPTEARLKMEKYGRAKQEERVWWALAPIRDRLSRHGCEVSLRLFEGSLRSYLKNYRKGHPASYTVIKPSRCDGISAVFRRFASSRALWNLVRNPLLDRTHLLCLSLTIQTGGIETSSSTVRNRLSCSAALMKLWADGFIATFLTKTESVHSDTGMPAMGHHGRKLIKQRGDRLGLESSRGGNAVETLTVLRGYAVLTPLSSR